MKRNINQRNINVMPLVTVPVQYMSKIVSNHRCILEITTQPRLRLYLK